MGKCPFHQSDSNEETTAPPDETSGQSHTWSSGRGIGRRAFIKSAVAIGGASALSAVLSTEAKASDTDSMSYPQGDPSNRPDQQYLWSPVGQLDAHGNPAPPSHQIVMLLEYNGDDIATDRDMMEEVCLQLEEAFAYDQQEGLCFIVGYSPAYFKRHSTDQPQDVDITEPRPVSPHNDPKLDRQDIFVQLASNQASIVLTAEAALFGEIESANGVDIDVSLAGRCTKAERRSVFAGAGLPAEEIDNDSIDDEAPLSMGFDSLYADSIPPEERITITDGPWTNGTVAMVSKLRLELDEWYTERDHAERIKEMFAPEYTPDDVGEFGEGLGEGSGREDGEGWEKELTERTDADAREKGVIGHSQKVTRARDDDFNVDLLRRDGDITIDGGNGGLSFVGLVEGISDWFKVGRAMYDTELDRTLREHDGRPSNDVNEHHPRSGIAAQMDVRARGHFLIPPRSLRALPSGRPD